MICPACGHPLPPNTVACGTDGCGGQSPSIPTGGYTVTVVDAAPAATGPMHRLRTPAVVGVVAVCLSTLATVASVVGPAAGVDLGIASDLTGPGAVLLSAGSLAWLVAAVAIMSWLHRVLTNVQSLPDVRQRWSPGWAVGAWFIPLANLVLPALVFHYAARAGLLPHERSARRLTTTVVLAWWFGFIGSSAVSGIALRTDLRPMTYWVLDGLMVALRITSAVAVIALLAWVTRRQERRFASTGALWDPGTRPPIPTRSLTPTTSAANEQ